LVQIRLPVFERHDDDFAIMLYCTDLAVMKVKGVDLGYNVFSLVHYYETELSAYSGIW
jgi:hypothetical protein